MVMLLPVTMYLFVWCFFFQGKVSLTFKNLHLKPLSIQSSIHSDFYTWSEKYEWV